MLPNIGAPAQRALHAAGVRTIKQLSKCSRKEIAELHGMGPKALGILEKALKEEGLSFSQ